jgi:hypothetical protein
LITLIDNDFNSNSDLQITLKKQKTKNKKQQQKEEKNKKIKKIQAIQTNTGSRTQYTIRGILCICFIYSSSSCVPYVASFSGLYCPLLIAPSIFSYVCLLTSIFILFF